MNEQEFYQSTDKFYYFFWVFFFWNAWWRIIRSTRFWIEFKTDERTLCYKKFDSSGIWTHASIHWPEFTLRVKFHQLESGALDRSAILSARSRAQICENLSKGPEPVSTNSRDRKQQNWIETSERIFSKTDVCNYRKLGATKSSIAFWKKHVSIWKQDPRMAVL